ncbi:cytochrome P450 [Amycolatopsis regifaucium]|uniref:Cytochrome n=1 Tax=Amycolatopsis regifaucium TaxID=546365 RepID=A0A154M425_9PSEU|nr:cytochrome P450 [Amycolatopsis regifaucium]KZB79371.1 cytochrome [Amycolatopsis regifaucium]OKA07554.1 cytochrome [Amycolatopsis regifaucium]SFH08466.1 Cytochrome P450 [Amycolatopsis regifaucium]
MVTNTEPATASIQDTLRVAVQVVLPTLAGGVIKRRPLGLAAAQKLQVDRPAVRLLGRLRARYGPGPLRLRVPGRSVDLALSAEDVAEVLAAAPVPFSPSTKEKRAALGHFQPHGVLISDATDRPPRRRFNEEVLEPGRPLHDLAAPFATVIAKEAASLWDKGTLDWDTFNLAWWRIVRQVTLGESAAGDDELTDMLARLRKDANWAYAHPRREELHERFRKRLIEHLERVEPGSLAEVIASATEERKPEVVADQVAHWLFAFDAAGIVTFRALALLATHPAARERADEELGDADLAQPNQFAYLRACALESVRLWPTTPALLRESTADTAWGPAGTTILIFTPFFHRDPESMPYADRFEPEIWLDGSAAANPALVPFSAGPAICPGRDLVLFCASTMLAHLIRDRRFELVSGAVLGPERPLPATLDNFHLKFELVSG